MAVTNVGKNRVYASIKDLPENQSILDGDKIIVDTDTGTCLIDYSNFKIDLEHTTFGQQFYDVVDLATSSANFIEQVQEQFLTIQQDTQDIKIKVNTLEEKMVAVELLLKLIMGSAANSNATLVNDLINNTVTGQGLLFYNRCKDAITATSNFDFSYYNLYNSRI